MEWDYVVCQRQAVRELRAISLSSGPENVLIRGEYGHGKTTLARLTAKSRGGRYRYYHIPPLPDDIDKYSVSLVIDEIHLTRQTEGYYELMNQDRLVIFCTTTTGKLPPAFLSRCTGITLRSYTTDEITTIVMKAMTRWGGVSLNESKAYEVAKRSHANPRIGIVLAKRVYRLLRMDNRAVTVSNVLAEFDAMGIDAEGLDDRHRAYISLLDQAKRPIGLLTISRSIGMDEGTIINEIEPALLRAGRLDITPRGRVLR